MADRDQVKRVGGYPSPRGRPEVRRNPDPSWPGVPGCLQERPEAHVLRSWCRDLAHGSSDHRNRLVI